MESKIVCVYGVCVCHGNVCVMGMGWVTSHLPPTPLPDTHIHTHAYRHTCTHIRVRARVHDMICLSFLSDWWIDSTVGIDCGWGDKLQHSNHIHIPRECWGLERPSAAKLRDLQDQIRKALLYLVSLQLLINRLVSPHIWLRVCYWSGFQGPLEHVKWLYKSH